MVHLSGEREPGHLLKFEHNLVFGLSVDERWKGLRNALSGLFCASLGSLDEQRTTSPVMTFRPEGSLPEWGSPHKLRHGTLPSENVCTENLTPFLKLLPCKSLSGIASLLNPHSLFDADWHGMGVHVRYIRNAGIEVRLSFQAVFDPVRYSADKRRGTISLNTPHVSGDRLNLGMGFRLVASVGIRSHHRQDMSCGSFQQDSSGFTC